MKNKTFVLKLASLLFVAALAVAPGVSLAKTINIDGTNDNGEWDGIAPTDTDENESTISNQHDIKACYLTADTDNLFLRIDTWGSIEWDDNENLYFFIEIDGDTDNGCQDSVGRGDAKFDAYVKAFPANGFDPPRVQTFICNNDTSWQGVQQYNNSNAVGDFLELYAPLDDLGISDPSAGLGGYVYFDNGTGEGEDSTPNTGTFEKESLLIQLKSFFAYLGDDGAVLQWETASEIDNAGFHIWRSDSKDGEYVRITDSMIPAQGDPVTETAYVYEDLDATGTNYFYRLQDIDYSGVSKFHDLTARYVALASGWNILEGDAFAGQSVSGALSTIDGNYASVWGLTASGWQTYDPDQPALSDLETFEAGNDYWLYVTDECDLALP